MSKFEDYKRYQQPGRPDRRRQINPIACQMGAVLRQESSISVGMSRIPQVSSRCVCLFNWRQNGMASLGEELLDDKNLPQCQQMKSGQCWKREQKSDSLKLGRWI